MQPKPIVAIVGRPNVGKSTLFNRLVGRRRAITADAPGTTRDRIYADGEWQGKAITFIDTGGLVEETGAGKGDIQQAINSHVQQALSEADAVLFVVDVQAGVSAADRYVADVVRKLAKKPVLVANKADNHDLAAAATAFWEVGLGEPFPVSSLHGRGTGDLADKIVASAGVTRATEEGDRTIPWVTLVGRSNVGKSTLLNQLAGSTRAITSSEMHTTRDVTSVRVDTAAGPIELLDTAGMRRRGQSGKGVPKYSLLRTIRAINESDVVCLLVDGVEGPTLGDAHIGSFVEEAGKAVVLAVNKWDLVEKDPDVQDTFHAKLSSKLGFLPLPPVVFLSALTGEKVNRLGKAIYDVYEVAGRHIATTELNSFLTAQVAELPGASGRKPPRLYYATQVGERPPTFAMFVNHPSSWADNHRRYLTNLLREHFQLYGTAIKLHFRAKKNDTSKTKT